MSGTHGVNVSIVIPFVDEAEALPAMLAHVARELRTCGDTEVIAVYGGFRHRFSGADWRLRAISALHNFRCRVTGNYYGDQGMFVLRSAFAAVGGFPVQQVEDIAICARLRALGAPTFLPLAVVTRSRKFERMGIWTSFARVVLILLCLRLGRKPPQAFFADIR